MNVGFVSLGCTKNLIDTEVIIGKLKKHKLKIVNNPEHADMIIINTCGFIEASKQEAIDTILEMSEYKQKRCKYLIATGCLVQRYYNDLIKALPEVDLFVKIEDYNNIWEKIEELIIQKEVNKTYKEKKKLQRLPMFSNQDYINRTISTGENYAYVKIGEGCSNMCTYCAIPYIRGLFVSRPMEDILSEVEKLAQKGIKEIIVIAQDTTKYGIDIYGKPMLAELLQKISEIDKIKWIRFLYSYPEGITEELIQTVKRNNKICKYFDIPIQHISNTILKKMNRKTSKKNIENLIKDIRKNIPNVTLRTSLIVGFPGETQEDFEQLYEFVKNTKFDKLGVFKYSKEEDTPAAIMKNQIHHKTKESRERKIMLLQKSISKEKLKENIGKNIEVLVEGKSFDGRYLIARTSRDIPEEDGIVYIKKNERNEDKVNQFILVKVTDVSEYDLIAESL